MNVGEKQMKNVTVAALVLVFAFLMISMLLAPAVAAPAQEMAFSGRHVPNLVQPPSPDAKTKLTKGDTVHMLNLNGAGTINSSLAVAWVTPNHQGTTSSIVHVNVNMKTGEGDIVYKMTWTFLTGSFSGNIVGRMSAPPFTQGQFVHAQDLHGVLRGDGAFEGWIITIRAEKPLDTYDGKDRLLFPNSVLQSIPFSFGVFVVCVYCRDFVSIAPFLAFLL